MSNKINQAFILAAGLGSRMRPLTITTPKPLIKVNDKAILAYTIERLASFGVSKIVINSHYLAEQIQEFITQIKSQYPYINFIVIYEPILMDSGGGCKNALKYLDNAPFFAINGDIIWLDDQNNTLEALNDFWNKNTLIDCLMLANPLNKTIGYNGMGDLDITDQNQVTKQSKRYVFTGIQILSPAALLHFNQDFFSLLEIYFSNDFTTKALININYWLHIGTPENLAQASEFLSNL
ncbi:nucleotidyltransferase family protein [Rickettsiales endosymbiont of Stachyamoeba lipophora]|uniref:nucleotidyltransferase family protein n=1 Tax=Rickettsiales endosymbiont of Stachyamoeba lipophora TaxID=2486578 RepID=UPI000F64A27E|nr:nucleotidyltransferase family protein [Rickettsiales endosymbiont of Stachyamoeba lipophora]AZL15703.1 nucleotidyltransferase family protein [Rickettsiales endosymbiont of Stachyamoeba lipophora]